MWVVEHAVVLADVDEIADDLDEVRHRLMADGGHAQPAARSVGVDEDVGG